MVKQWRIQVADPSPLFRQGIRLMLDTLDRPVQVLEVSHPMQKHDEQALNGYSRVDLAILSAALVDADHLVQLRRGALGNAPVLLMTEGADSPSPIRPRVQGLIDKSRSLGDFRQAVTTLLAGKTWLPAACRETNPVLCLSGKQQRVLALIGEGHSNKQIAARLHLSESTVKHHISRIYRLLALDNPTRTRLALYAPPGKPAAQTMAEPG